MALKQGTETFTKWTHVENGKILVRRIQRLEVQARDGRLYIITGEDLPDFIQTNTGNGTKGDNLAQILLKGGQKPTFFRMESRPWPTARDAFNFLIGFCLIGFLKVMVSILSQMF